MSVIKDGNYIVIQSFMIKDLKLKGNELLIYAAIYGFSQAENQAFTGGLQYLAEWTNSTKQGVIKNLKSLIEKGFILKDEKYINGVKFCEYHVTKFNGVLNKVEQGIKQSLTPPIKHSLPNNIDINKQDNNINNNNEQIEQEFNNLWEMYPKKQGKANALKAYIKARKGGAEYQTILVGLNNYITHIQADKVEYKYIKQGSTWFNQQCWQDVYKNSFAPAERDEELDAIF